MFSLLSRRIRHRTAGLLRTAGGLAVCCVQPGELIFPSKRGENRAVQVVQVRAASRQQPPVVRAYTFSFCLERVDVGPYKVIACLACFSRCHACEAC